MDVKPQYFSQKNEQRNNANLVTVQEGKFRIGIGKNKRRIGNKKKINWLYLSSWVPIL